MQNCPDIACMHRTCLGGCSLTACIRQDIITQAQIDPVQVIPHGFVKVVRCKDCKHVHRGRCMMTLEGGWNGDDWFCADGERRDGDATG